MALETYDQIKTYIISLKKKDIIYNGLDDIDSKITFVSELFSQGAKFETNDTYSIDYLSHLKYLVGKYICDELEEQSKKLKTVNDDTREFIIPVGIPGSGKSKLTDNFKSNAIILDADEVRENIFNSVYKEFFKEEIIFNKYNKDGTVNPKWNSENNNKFIDYLNQDNYFKKIFTPVKHYVNFGIMNKHLPQNVIEMDKEITNCEKGIEGYCPSKSKIKDLILFLPSAFNIYLIYCKDKKYNFLYDAPNCQPKFRNNLMVRGKKYGNFKNFKIAVLLPNLHNLVLQLNNRDKNGIRKTPLSDSVRRIAEFFEINPLYDYNIDIFDSLLPSINGTDILTKLLSDINEKKSADKILDDIKAYEKPDFHTILIKLFKKLYDKVNNIKCYGSEQKNFDADIINKNYNANCFFYRFNAEGIIEEVNVTDYIDLYGEKIRGEKFGLFDGGKKTKKRKSNKIKTKRKKGKRKIIRPTKTKRKRYTKRR